MSHRRRAIYTESFLTRLEEILGWYEEKGAFEYCRRFTTRLFEEVEPRLLDYPASGAPLRDLERISSLSPELLTMIELPETKLELREVIIEGHVLLYGFDELRVVFLYVKHGRQERY